MRTSTIGFLAAGAVLTVLSGTAAAQNGPYQYFAITPCRLYDSRAGQPSALGTGGGMITTTMNPSDPTTLRSGLHARGACGVPNTAQAITVNHTVINPTAPGPGSLSRMCPKPNTGQTVCRAWVVYAPNETTSNGGVLPLGTVANPGTDDDFQIQGIGANPQGNLGVYTYDWTVDITGYFQ
jgi:hypothetical protein